MNSRLILLVAIIALFASCKTTKTATTENLKVVEQNDIHETTTAKTEVTEKETISMSVDALTTIIERIINTRYSQPDTAGNQHITETTTTEREITIDKASKADTQKTTQIEQVIEDEKTDNSSKNIDKKTETKTTIKSKTPAWVIIAVSILSIGVILLLYFVLKRFKLIK
jgi:hypothetical protein